MFENIWRGDGTTRVVKITWNVNTIPKKGDLSKCKNWCGAILLAVASKIYTRVIFVNYKVLSKEPGRFWKGMILFWNVIHFESYDRWRIGTSDVPLNQFCRHSKAFDSVMREVKIRKILGHFGVSQVLMDLNVLLHTKVICIHIFKL